MGRTRIEKLWLGGAAVVALLIAVVGYFFLVGPQRAQTQDVQSQVSDAQTEAVTLQSQITSLTSEQKNAATYRRALAQARAALPAAGDLAATPALLTSLQGIAHASSSSVSSLTVGDPTAVVPAAAPTDTSTASTSSASASSSTTVTATPAVGLYSVNITASVKGSTRSLVDFLQRLQHRQPRAVLISAVSIGGATSSGGQTMSLTMTAFVRPAATAAEPSAASTP